MKKIIFFIFCISFSFCQAQSSFETNLIYNINWGDTIYHRYPDDMENPLYSVSTFIKCDNRYFGFEDDEILRFLIENLRNGKLIALNGKDTLSKSDLMRVLYWKLSFDTETNDTIWFSDFEKLKKVKIHQKWIINTMKNTMSNYVLGITLLKEDEEDLHDLFYIPFQNEPKKITINDDEIAYIREFKNKCLWDDFNKREIVKILTAKPGEFYLESVGINKFNKDSFRIKNLDSIFKNFEIFESNLFLAVLSFSKGIYVNQSLYIDIENVSINTTLNAISPLFPVSNDYWTYNNNDDGTSFLLPLYWLNFRELE